MPNRDNLIEKERTTRENRVWVRIAAACNVKCVFCLDADAQNGKLISDDTVRKEIRDSFKPGVYNRVILSWWEASINPKFPEYIRYAKEIWYDRVQTVTNGNMFSRLDFCQKVFEAWLDEVTFSIHGHNALLHDHLTGAPGSYERALRGLINIRKLFPKTILNIDIVVNKLNVVYLPQMVLFFMRLGVYEFDILQIVPFGRGFREHKDELFYHIEDYLGELHATWSLSKLPGIHIWTNRLPVEAFEGYEDLIQDPRKIKSETMGEQKEMFDAFIRSDAQEKPDCYGERCDVCFLKQYCHDYRDYHHISLSSEKKYIIGNEDREKYSAKYIILRGEEFPSQVYKKYGNESRDFLKYIQNIKLNADQKLVNIPRCIRSTNNNGEYEWNRDIEREKSVWEYTKNYIMNFYRKKSLRCKSCKYNDSCQGIHINFLRSYWFQILSPISK